jgi:hypothetical protein
LDVHRLAVFVEQLAGEGTARRLGLSTFATANAFIAQPLLDAVPKFVADDRLVLSRMAFALVSNLAQIERVGEQVVKRSTRELPAAP